jgi:TonB family protein
MRTVAKRSIPALCAAAALAGCALSGGTHERAVDNPMPPLKAGVYSDTAVAVRPVATKEGEPDFPPELRGVPLGKAVVLFTVRADGTVADASTLTADDVLFGEAAVTAVLKWKFHPAQVNGAPVDCRMTLPFYFSNPYGYSNDYVPAGTNSKSPDVPEGLLAPGGGAGDARGASVEQH